MKCSYKLPKIFANSRNRKKLTGMWGQHYLMLITRARYPDSLTWKSIIEKRCAELEVVKSSVLKGYCTFVLQYLKVIIGLLQWPTCAKIIYLNLFFIGKVMALILHL